MDYISFYTFKELFLFIENLIPKLTLYQSYQLII